LVKQRKPKIIPHAKDEIYNLASESISSKFKAYYFELLVRPGVGFHYGKSQVQDWAAPLLGKKEKKRKFNLQIQFLCCQYYFSHCMQHDDKIKGIHQ